MIEAYATLRARYAPTEHLPPLIIAGGNGWKYDAILAALEQTGVAGSVRFLGRVPDEDLPTLIAGSRVFMYPSLYEGFGLPPLEALTCGAPVVVSRAASLLEVVDDAGLCCAPYDAHDIAHQIAALLDDTDLALRNRSAGIARAVVLVGARCPRDTCSLRTDAR